MPQPSKTAEQQSVVLLGHFNPSIVQPRWPPIATRIDKFWNFDAGAIEGEVIVIRELARFSFLGVTLQVEPGRFQITDESPAGRRVADFVEELFSTDLPHTRCRAVGMNYQCTVKCATKADRDRIGYKLAPTAPWGPYSKLLDGENGGLLKLSVRLPIEGNNERTYRMVTVSSETPQPTGDQKFTFIIQVNTHVELQTEPEPDGHYSASKLIPSSLAMYDDAMKESSEIAQTLMKL